MAGLRHINTDGRIDHLTQYGLFDEIERTLRKCYPRTAGLSRALEFELYASSYASSLQMSLSELAYSRFQDAHPTPTI